MTYLPHHCTAYPCPICQQLWPPLGGYTYPPLYTPMLEPLHGCICPAGSEQTCCGESCPRLPAELRLKRSAASCQ